jgi:deoxyadenosine/deoxycytidine kinase
MGKIITVIGNCGSGKTTFTKLLCQQPGFQPLLEQHAERPFQRLAMEDRRWAFHNQVDYLLYRAEQELAARQAPGIFVADGGLDQDFYIFTRLFYEKGLYTPAEFGVCQRLYAAFRQALPTPDQVIRLVAPMALMVQRRTLRNRELDITADEDLPRIETLLAEFEQTMKGKAPVLRLDFSGDAAGIDFEAIHQAVGEGI